jgi:hypothetical protein
MMRWSSSPEKTYNSRRVWVVLCMLESKASPASQPVLFVLEPQWEPVRSDRQTDTPMRESEGGLYGYCG